jgi:hypothetical protein
MLPITILLLFVKNYVFLKLKSSNYVYEDDVNSELFKFLINYNFSTTFKENMYFEYNEDEEEIDTKVKKNYLQYILIYYQKF